MGHRIIPRKEWGARYGSSGIKRPLPVAETWLHHSVTVAPDMVPPWSDDFSAIRTIDSIGYKRFGSYAFPYTFAITPAGLIFEGHPIDEIGAHTQGHNTIGAGIVFVGNYEHVAPTREMLEALTWLLHEGVRRGWWRSAKLTGGHRDTKATACPGDRAYALIDDINVGRYEEDEMPLSREERQTLEKTYAATRWIKAALGGTNARDDDGDRVDDPARTDLRNILRNTHKAVRQNVAIQSLVTTIAENGGLDPERVYEIVDRNLKEALENVEITLSAVDEEEPA